MTPSEILKHWNAAATFTQGRHHLWIKMMLIAEAGECGISQTQLGVTRDRLMKSVKQWQTARLITTTQGPKTPGRRAVVIKATPRLHALLKLTKS